MSIILNSSSNILYYVIIMNDRPFLQQSTDRNPVNINIEFNINGNNQNKQAVKGRRIELNQLQPECYCTKSKTPDLPQTDRNIYSKQIDYLKPMEEQKVKKKIKRNSMDLSTPSQKCSKQKYQHHSKGHTLNLFKKPEINQIIKNEQLKKKKSKFKQDAQQYKKAYLQNQSKSATINDKSQRKGQFYKSLKNIIHKINNAKSSKKSLLSSTYNNRFNSTSFDLNSINLRMQKKTRKKLKTQKSKKGSQKGLQNKDEIVEKLNSLKSMTNSVLKSQEYDDNPYYSNIKQKIHIQTDQSIELIDQISYYENKTNKNQIKKMQSISNIQSMKNTGHLIENFLKMFEQCQDQPNREVYFPEASSIPELKQQVRNLFGDNSQLVQLISDQHLSSQNQKNSQKQENKKKRNQKETQEMRPYMSSQINKSSIANQLEKQRLQQLRKQQIQKWGYLLQFIKNNMNNQEADTQTILAEVYWFLERSKNDLQRDQFNSHQNSFQSKSKKQDLEQFTVKLSDKKQELSSGCKDFYEEKERNQQQELDIQDFRGVESEEEESFKGLNFQIISQALRGRHKSLLEKREKQLSSITNKLQGGKITPQQYDQQKLKIEKWIKNEVDQINKAKDNIWKGYSEAKCIIGKTINSKMYENKASKQTKIMKCLSETYLRKNNLRQAIEKSQQPNESNQKEVQQEVKPQKIQKYQEQDHYYDNSDEFQNNQDQESSNSQKDSHSEEMKAIKQRLLKMKKDHFSGQDEVSSPAVSYQQIQKQIQEDKYSDEEINIIKRESGNYNRIKYLCAEDKEDIFQFIFLDLCIELYQEPCQNNSIMKGINNHIKKAQLQAKKKKGIRTNLNVIKEYLKRFTSFLLRTQRSCLKSLDTPMGPSALQMLRYMHENQYQMGDEQQQVPTLIISIGVFEKFQKTLEPTLEFEEYYDDPEKQDARIEFLKTILHIHNKALFDSLNQLMDQQRPFGIWGKPFPWKKTSSFCRSWTEQEKEQKLEKCTDKVIENCSYVCGLMVDKEQSLVANARLSESYISQIQQDRLSRMLANELVQNQQRWLFYDDQQTQVLVEISTFIWKKLASQLMTELAGF